MITPYTNTETIHTLKHNKDNKRSRKIHITPIGNYTLATNYIISVQQKYTNKTWLFVLKGIKDPVHKHRNNTHTNTIMYVYVLFCFICFSIAMYLYTWSDCEYQCIVLMIVSLQCVMIVSLQCVFVYMCVFAYLFLKHFYIIFIHKISLILGIFSTICLYSWALFHGCRLGACRIMSFAFTLKKISILILISCRLEYRLRSPKKECRVKEASLYN